MKLERLREILDDYWLHDIISDGNIAELQSIPEEQAIKMLTRLSIDDKWKDRLRDTHSRCPFCHFNNAIHQDEQINTCKNCLCPPEICTNYGRGGIIAEINDNLTVGDLMDKYPDKYKQLITEFKKHL